MEAPKCKICGERHWGLCVAPQDEPSMIDIVISSNALLTTIRTPKEFKKFNKTAYQREYMRKRRAKEKAK